MNSNRTFIIAEAGVNHNGSLDTARKLIDAASDAGADAVKFQTFTPELLVTEDAGLAEYQERNIGTASSQYKMLSDLSLSPDDHQVLLEKAASNNIQFLSTPFDIKSIRLLCEDLKLKTIKIPSGELTNGPYLWKIASYKPDIILSTGMAELDEIELALDVLAHGLNEEHMPGSLDEVSGYSKSENGQRVLKTKVKLLQSTTDYPAPHETLNLNAISTLRNKFGLEAGLSDHSDSIILPAAAIACGATIIEKHITLDKQMQGPDHKASIEPDQFSEMVDAIRSVEKAMGTGEKKPFPNEIRISALVRKSLYVTRDITKGEEFREEDLIAKRPVSGVSPMHYWDLVGTNAVKSYKAGDPV